MIGGDEGVEVGIGVPVSGATGEDVDACRLAASSVARVTISFSFSFSYHMICSP